MALVGGSTMDELIIRMLENAPAVAVLVYLVWRLDSRLAEMQGAMLELLRQAKE